MAPLNILIVGCGVAGPMLATCLLISDTPAESKPRIAILERSSSLRAQGQNIDLRGAGVTIMRRLGMEKVIRSSTTGEEGVQFIDDRNQVWGQFGADKTGKTSTPTADIEILRGKLAQICWTRCKLVGDQVQKQGGPGIEFIFGDRLDELDQDGDKVNVRLAKSGQRRSFDLVVGADGLQSQVRKLAWGAEGDDKRIHHLGAYIGFFSIPAANTDSDWRRWYHAPDRRGIMLRPSGNKDTTTVLTSVVRENSKLRQVAEQRGPDGVKAQKKVIEEFFSDVGWVEKKRVLDEMMAAEDFYYDMVGQVKMDRWSKGRVVLLGDAGYCASPFSGMGTTLAFKGAWNLAGSLTRHPNDFGAAFDEYEKQMRPVVAKAQKLAPGMPHSLHPETAWGVWILNAIMFLFGASGLMGLVASKFGPPAHSVPVEEYGFRQLEEMEELIDGEQISG